MSRNFFLKSFFYCLILLPTLLNASTVTVNTTHFWINYETNPGNEHYATPEYIEYAKTIAEDVWNYFIVNQGYLKPPNAVDNPIDDSQRVGIKISDREIGYYGATSRDNEARTTPPGISIDNNYSEPGWKISGLDALRITLAHEFFHCIQQAYAHANVYNPTTLDWFWEGTGAWAEDEPILLAGVNIDTINSYLPDKDNYAMDFLDSPELSLDARIDANERYGIILFYKYLTEKGYSVRKILEKLQALNLIEPDNSKMLKTIGEAIGGRRPFDIYADFSAACIAKTGTFGFQDDGASQIPDAIRVACSTQTDPNAHIFNLGAVDVSHLSSRYISVVQPSLLDKASWMRGELIVHGPVWGPKAILVPVSGERAVLDMLPSQGKRVVESSFGITRSTPQTGEIQEVVVSVANVSDTQNKSWSEFTSAIVPQFREVYTPDDKTGTTKTVKNLKHINHWFNGDTIQLEITLSGPASIDPAKDDIDFSQFDSNFTARKVIVSSGIVTPEGVRYTITYPISTTNTRNGRAVATIKAWDLSRDASNAESFVGYVGIYETRILNTGSSPQPWGIGNPPVLSPDGNWICFMKSNVLWKIRPDGTGLVQLTTQWRGTLEGYPAFSVDGCPSWSPDGQYIAFTRRYLYGYGPVIYYEYTMELYQVDSDGSGLTRLTSPGKGQRHTQPDWSPLGTGAHLVFFRHFDLPHPENSWVLALRLLTGELKNITPSGPAYQVSDEPLPRWSPKGDKIVFQNIYEGEVGIWLVNPDGTGLVKIVAEPEWTSISRGPQPYWSPDGSRILYRLENKGLWLIRPDGSSKVQISTYDWPVYYPTWSRDGSKIAFHSVSEVVVLILKPEIESLEIQTLAIASEEKTIENADAIFKLGEYYSYPNPAKNGKNPTLYLECGIADKVELKIFDLSGDLIHAKDITDKLIIVDNRYAYEYPWDISDIPSGVYIYTIRAKKQQEEKDITVTKRLAIIR